jgi:glycosyltransferase involved in cell wall biosynthesis
MSRPNPLERAQQTRRLLRSEGYAGVADRLRARAVKWISPAGSAPLLVAREDLVRAAEIADAGWRLPAPLPLRADDPLEVAWVCVPQTAGAGGFTTMYRLVSALEQAGHRCTIYLLDRHGWALEQHQRTMRGWWPSLRAEIRDAAAGIDDAHAIFATSWETAYPVLTSPAKGARCYLVQDFEPRFYAAGSNALLAEATYRFGFHGLTAGRWLAQLLEREYGMAADSFDFGCEHDRYRLQEGVERTGVCLYARPSTPRRAFELAAAALDLFAERHPEVDIHLYGESVKGLPFAAHDHGLLTPEQLNDLYNRCVAGLVLSATNVSLVPHEMLAAGCIPVVNDAEQSRMVLDNPEVVYAPATPFDLANALAALLERPADERRAAAQTAAASVSGTSWEEAGVVIERVVRAAVQGAAGVPRAAVQGAAGVPRAAVQGAAGVPRAAVQGAAGVPQAAVQGAAGVPTPASA